VRAWWRNRLGDSESGAAVLEFTMLSVLVLVPVLYLLLTVFRVQAASFAVTQAAREAGRAYATADSAGSAAERARVAAGLAFSDQGVPIESSSVTWAAEPASGTANCGRASAEPPPLVAGQDVLVCVHAVVRLPFADRGVLGRLAATGVDVSSRYVVAVDPLRAGS
jgi:hypothetical protein